MVNSEDFEPEDLPEAAITDDDFEVALRNKQIIEALLFASAEPLSVDAIRGVLGEEARVEELIAELREDYGGRGVNIVVRDGSFAFRTAEDLQYILRREQTERRPMGRAALETLAVVAYHQPVTRAEIEEIRGVSMSKGTLDILLEAGFIRMRGRKRTPGRPVTYGTTPLFLDHFGLEQLRDLPGLDELKGAGFLSRQVPAEMQIPIPFDGELHPDEDPLAPGDAGDEDESGPEEEA